MSDLLAGKTALILGVANRWSLAYAIAQAFVREGGKLILTYQGDRQKGTVQDLANELAPGTQVLACDVTIQQELDNVVNTLRAEKTKLDVLVHSIAFANREDLSRPFIETSRDGYLIAQEVSAYSLVSVSRSFAPLMNQGGSDSYSLVSGRCPCDPELQRDGCGESGVRSLRPVPCTRPRSVKHSGERNLGRSCKNCFGTGGQRFIEDAGWRGSQCAAAAQYRSGRSSRCRRVFGE